MQINKLGLVLTFFSSITFADSYNNLDTSVVEEFKLLNSLVQNEAILHEIDNIPCRVIQNTTTTLNLSATRYVHWFALAGCGGGNHHEEYLMLVQNHDGVWTNDGILQIGGDYNFTVTNLVWNRPDMLTVYGNSWFKTDAHCCPTKHTQKQVKVVSNKLEIM